MSVTAVPLRPTSRRALVLLWIGLLVALCGGVALAFAGTPTAPGTATASGLRYEVLTEGTGPTPSDTDVALVNYKGALTDGTEFDASKQPMPLPVDQMIPGFSEGLKLMNKGSKYRFWIPPELGYGDKATGPIPANSTLVFEVELVDFIPAQVLQQMQMQQMMQGMGGAQGGAQGAPGGAAPPPAP
jgi:FKBP-type peptidyl-prolyl cis-trans isomerase FkpA